MRILYLTHNVTWKGGGAFFRAYHQGRLLAAHGHQVTLVSISPRRRTGFAESLSRGVRIVESPDLLPGKGRTGWDLWDALHRCLYLRRESFDLIHGCESRPAVALPALWLGRTRRIPTILDWADWYGRGGTAHERGRWLRLAMEPIETFCEEVFHPLADACVAMGEPLVERAVASGLARDRVLNLLHGCDPDGIRPGSLAAARQQLAQLPAEGYVLSYLGVIRENSARLMFESFRQLKRSLAGPGKLVLIGNHKLPLASLLPDDLAGDVVETGWVSYEQLNLYLAASDLLLLPFVRTVATDSIWPSKLNDYLAAGRPTVATNMRILGPLFARHEIGLLTEDTPAAFAEGCRRLLTDPSRRTRLGANARAVAEGELAWDTLVSRLEEFYCRLVGSPRAAAHSA